MYTGTYPPWDKEGRITWMPALWSVVLCYLICNNIMHNIFCNIMYEQNPIISRIWPLSFLHMAPVQMFYGDVNVSLHHCEFLDVFYLNDFCCPNFKTTYFNTTIVSSYIYWILYIHGISCLLSLQSAACNEVPHKIRQKCVNISQCQNKNDHVSKCDCFYILICT
jgi:hypothetical protein